jgi:hypothetical protein
VSSADEHLSRQIEGFSGDHRVRHRQGDESTRWAAIVEWSAFLERLLADVERLLDSSEET